MSSFFVIHMWIQKQLLASTASRVFEGLMTSISKISLLEESYTTLSHPS